MGKIFWILSIPFKDRCLFCGKQDWAIKMVDEAFWAVHRDCEYVEDQELYF